MAYELTEEEKDQLREVINIGAGSATTSLSKFWGKSVLMSVPEIFFEEIGKAPTFFGDPMQIRTTVLVELSEGVPAYMFLSFPYESVHTIAEHLTGKKYKAGEPLDDMEVSALKESANIASGSALTAFANFLGVRVMQSVPDVATDMFGAITDAVLTHMGMGSEDILVFRIKFTVGEERTPGDMHFFFAPSSTQKIIDIIRKKMGE